MRLMDTHAHLDFPFLHEQLETIIDQAKAQHVERIVTIGASRELESNYRALEIARQYPELIRCTAGIHPHDADMASDEVIEKIRSELSSLPEVVGIGETGLDYHYNRSDPAKQRQVFSAFLEMAKEVQKPVIIHSRDAEEDTIALLREANISRGIIHCFSGSQAFAEAALELDFYISFSGIVTFKSAASILEVSKIVPAERILVETDSPYLAPIPHRGKKNQPGYVYHTAQVVAEARGESLEEFAAQTWQNSCRVFSWAD